MYGEPFRERFVIGELTTNGAAMNKVALAVLLLALCLGLTGFVGEPDPLREEAQVVSVLLALFAAALEALTMYRRRPRIVYN